MFLETNVVIPGVYIPQAISLLLAAIAVLVIVRLVLSSGIFTRLPKAARRVVLQPALVSVYSQLQPALRSLLLPVSISTRAPPIFLSNRADSFSPGDPSGS
jgi:hypothetical protein